MNCRYAALGSAKVVGLGSHLLRAGSEYICPPDIFLCPRGHTLAAVACHANHKESPFRALPAPGSSIRTTDRRRFLTPLAGVMGAQTMPPFRMGIVRDAFRTPLPGFALTSVPSVSSFAFAFAAVGFLPPFDQHLPWHPIVLHQNARAKRCNLVRSQLGPRRARRCLRRLSRASLWVSGFRDMQHRFRLHLAIIVGNNSLP